MSIFDRLKKKLALGNSLLATEPECIRYVWFTLRLPPGWQFTKADNRSFAAFGPGGCSAEFTFQTVMGLKLAEFEKHRPVMVQIMQRFLKGEGRKDVGPAGVLWMEADEVQAEKKILRIALFNTQPGDPEEVTPPILQVACTMPGSSSGADPEPAPFEQLRSALRGTKWN